MKACQPWTADTAQRRWIGVFLFLAISFLPLHFHVATASTAQINKECSCLDGSRTQTGQIAPPNFSIPVACRLAVFSIHQQSFVARSVRNYSSRAPPAF
jgi:hypothetical protein